MTPRERGFVDDPAVLVGGLHIVVCQSRRLHWTISQVDRASLRMAFPDTGSIDAPAKGFHWLTECMLEAAEEVFDQAHQFGP